MLVAGGCGIVFCDHPPRVKRLLPGGAASLSGHIHAVSANVPRKNNREGCENEGGREKGRSDHFLCRANNCCDRLQILFFLQTAEISAFEMREEEETGRVGKTKGETGIQFAGHILGEILRFHEIHYVVYYCICYANILNSTVCCC